MAAPAPTRFASVLLAVALLVAASGCQQRVDMPAEPSTVKIEPAPVLRAPAEGAYTGIFAPPAPFDMTYIDRYSELTGKSPAIVMWFQPWAKSGASMFDRAAVVSVLQRGAVPMITWEPWDPGEDPNYLKEPAEQSDFRLKRIIDGEFDAYIRSWARAAKQVGGPIMIRPMHEMNGDWYPWCGTVNGNKPEEFTVAWRHMVDIFEKEGATNVTWVWSINRESTPDVPKNAFDVYYPGDDYVDWTSISGFNWGTSRPITRWSSFTELYDAPLAYLRTIGKPIVLSEFGSVPDGGDKAAWLRDAYREIGLRPEIDAVVYYDKLEEGLKLRQDWRISSSQEAEDAFVDAVAPSHFLEGPVPELREWGSALSQDEWSYLRAIQPVY